MRSNTSKKGSKGRKGKRKIKSTLPTEPTASDGAAKGALGRRKKGRSSSKRRMPPWLARYENDDTLDGSYLLLEESQSSAPRNPDDAATDGSLDDNQGGLSEMQRLELALNGIFHHPAAAPGSIPAAISHFAPSDIHDVLDAVRAASHGNANMMAGCADFLYLMLTLEEEGALPSDLLRHEPWDDDDLGTGEGAWEEDAASDRFRDGREPHSIMTRPVLVAAAFHYCDCVRARRLGVYDYAKRAMEASLDRRVWEEMERKPLWLPPAEDMTDDRDLGAVSADENGSIVVGGSNSDPNRRRTPIEEYGDESPRIAAGAAQLKRAEIMSAIVNSNGRANRPNGDAEILRSFLVSLSEDWRALVIRSAACLYRLKGIAAEQEYASMEGGGQSAGSIVLSTTAINTAKEAFRVYAPLAQRLGMQRLKTELENTAFRILYPRQFSVASSLYDIDEMRTIVTVLSSRIEQLLRSDRVFHDQLEDIAVTSRVKEPYSLWRKLLRYRVNSVKDGTDRQNLSLLWVPDAIALRVVLSARPLSLMEDEESLRTREKMLCYYALQLISDVWPASASNVAKDYIKNPKPNGYQSLHYTASLAVSGQEWPFEVQIRSEEMYQIAEFGVAAHWDYKLQTKVVKSLPDKPLASESHPILALPAAGNCTEINVDTQQLKVNTSEVLEVPEISSRSGRKGRIASYIEALGTSRETIVENSLFIFVSSSSSALEGKIVSVDPSSSSVADILEKYGAMADCEGILEDSPDGGLEMYLNGVPCNSMEEKLSNGDVLTLPSHIIGKLRFEAS